MVPQRTAPQRPISGVRPAVPCNTTENVGVPHNTGTSGCSTVGRIGRVGMKAIQDLWRRRVRVTGVVEQVAVGSPDEMAAIYEDYGRLVHRRCLATLGDEQAAEDATQDVFLLALSNFEQIQHDVVRGLLDIARTISYERRRRPAREVSLADPGQHRNGSGADDPAEIAER